MKPLDALGGFTKSIWAIQNPPYSEDLEIPYT